MAKNPYTLLGIKKDASDAEIRKAYRGLAKKLHPDVNPDDKKSHERFKEISAAYSLLSDKKLRKQYDSGQVDGSGQQQNPFRGAGPQTGFGGFGGMGGRGGQDDMADLFSSLFGMNTGGGGFQQRRAPAKKGADRRYRLQLSLIQALKGGQQEISSGLKMKIPAGVNDGQVLRLRGKGEPGVNGGPAGDAKVEITIKPHKNLSRKGDDLHLTLPISLGEAIRGAKIKLDMPNGTVSLNLPEGTNTGQKLRLKGKGVAGGNLVVLPVITLTNAEIALKKGFIDVLPEKNDPSLRRGLL